ncbi:hypothetical protein ACTXT7_007389 [Hymenolepis weldensis]
MLSELEIFNRQIIPVFNTILTMLHDEMVMGAVLVHCTGQTASFADSLRDKLVNWKLKTTGMNPATESFLILHRFGCNHRLWIWTSEV